MARNKEIVLYIGILYVYKFVCKIKINKSFFIGTRYTIKCDVYRYVNL